MTEIEKAKCENTGNWINMCEALSEVTSNSYGDITAQIKSRRDMDSRRISIVAGKSRGNRVELNYCPFCGADIATEHKEPAND
ncbi:hypothetical protein [Acinetobacter sp. YH12045]|uniref:hypothetical protein n=1 Tax=Acinetobacter sp. YH12045 TaxID=2601051 RepID=UPI0015D30FE4|nr:hypothetical protein [Acinetobacter sp. YH12045]